MCTYYAWRTRTSAQPLGACREEWEAGGFEGGIIHGGRGKLLGVQVLGGVVIIAWVALTIGPTFYLLKYFNLFRVPTEVQISVHVRSLPNSDLRARP